MRVGIREREEESSQMSTRDGALLASAARTTLQNTEAQSSRGLKHLTIIVDVTVDPASAAITPSLQALDPASGKWVTVWTAAAALTAVGTAIYALGVGILASVPGGFTDVENIPIPPTWRFHMAVADTDSMTYSVGFTLTG